MKRTIAWALEKRAEDGLSDEILDMLDRNARGSMGKDEVTRESSGQGLHGIYINSDRGASLRTVVARGRRYGAHLGFELQSMMSISANTAVRVPRLVLLAQARSISGNFGKRDNPSKQRSG